MEKFDDEFGDLSGYKILSFDEVSKGFVGNNKPLDNILLNNPLQLGRTILGMTHVSPLATKKFYGRTSEEIFNIYYPDAENLERGNTHLVTDIGVPNPEYEFHTENFFFDRNHNGTFGDTGDILAFKLLLFVSTDGLKVKECYEVTEPNDDEVILFLETDGGLSKQVLYGKMSEKVKARFTDENGNLKSNLYDDQIMKGVRKYYSDANQEVIEELMKKGYVEGSIIKEGFFKLLKYMGIATTALPKVIGWVLEKIGNGIDFLQIPEEFWDTENEVYFLKKENLLERFVISTDGIKKLEELLNNKEGLNVTDLMPQAIEEGILYVLTKMRAIVESYNQFVTQKIEEIYEALDNPVADFVFGELAESFAFLAGFWNGAVDFISGIFKFAGGLLQAPFDLVNNYEEVLEVIDNFWDAITNNNFWSNLWESMAATYQKIKQELQDLKLQDLNWVRIAYFSGFGLAFIASFFVPFANIANVGKVGKIIATFTGEISSGFVKGATILTQKSKPAVQNTLKIFREIIEVIKNGGENLYKFFNKIWKKIVEWFKRNKKDMKKAGMAEDISTGIKMTVKEFEEGLKRLSNIKPNEALKYLDEAMIYFNHHIVNGKVVQISDRNCVNVVKVLDEFLKTGKIYAAKASNPQDYFVLEKLYGKSFLSYNFSTLNKVIKEGERGILLCQRGEGRLSHVLNVIKRDGKLIFKDGQSYSQEMNLLSEYKSFKYLKTN